ncbi:MAG: ketoacyl-ACP synthase III [Bacteriovoracaceae bacterium]|nr:ketoacyl-ACP synthase III [Bacteriovoracaceae bacterium]
MASFKTKISGTGKYHPTKVMTNFDFEKLMDTNDQWITERTGIKERRIAKPEETTVSMSTAAAKMAITEAGIDPNEIDMILFQVTMPDQFFPNSASFLQEALGITNKCACLDINAACSGYLYGFTIADSLIKNGIYKNILLIGAEKTSAFNGFKDRNTAVLFGDAAGATLLSRAERSESSEVLGTILGSDSSKKDSLAMPNGGAASPITKEIIERGEEKLVVMNGQVVFKTAVKTMAQYSAELLEKSGLGLDGLDWFIPHQANLRIIEAVAQMVNCPANKIISNVDKYANTSSASIPVTINEAVASGKIKRGDTILMTAFGAGLTSAGVLIRY